MDKPTGQLNQLICKRCNKKKIIYAKGLCKSDYNYSKVNKDKQKEYSAKWKENNPNYFKEHYKKKKVKQDE